MDEPPPSPGAPARMSAQAAAARSSRAAPRPSTGPPSRPLEGPSRWSVPPTTATRTPAGAPGTTRSEHRCVRWLRRARRPPRPVRPSRRARRRPARPGRFAPQVPGPLPGSSGTMVGRLDAATSWLRGHPSDRRPRRSRSALETLGAFGAVAERHGPVAVVEEPARPHAQDFEPVLQFYQQLLIPFGIETLGDQAGDDGALLDDRAFGDENGAIRPHQVAFGHSGIHL